MNQNHQLTTTSIHSIADDIYKAVNRERPQERFVTTKERQIDFMWHLLGQGFSAREIAEIYNTSPSIINDTLSRKSIGMRVKTLKRNS